MNLTKNEDLLKLETRRRIYNFILKYPGLHLRKICRKLKIPKTTMDYHLNYLKKHDLILIKTERGYNYYYVSKKVGNIEKKILAAIRQKTPRNIILFLFLYPKKSRKDMVKELGTKPSTISYYLKKLKKLDLIDSDHIGRKTVYNIKDQKAMYHLFIKYEESLLLDDMVIDHLLNWVKYAIPDGVPKRKSDSKSTDVDDVYNMLLEIFPNPFQ